MIETVERQILKNEYQISVTRKYERRTKQILKKTLPDTYGPDVIRTHDLPVISRAHHRAMLRAQKFA